jgi:hypothetical protein
MWDFKDYSDSDLQEIYEHCKALENLGIEQNDDMMTELAAEVNKRQDQNS